MRPSQMIGRRRVAPPTLARGKDLHGVPQAGGQEHAMPIHVPAARTSGDAKGPKGLRLWAGVTEGGLCAM